jgi:hypothetical protein
MPRKPREIASKLTGKFGFVEAESRSTDHRWFELRLEGLPVILTKLSHNRDEVGSKLEGKIARQLRVRKSFFDGMMDCTNDARAYERQVREDPVPPFDVRF